ncbi:Uncharacterized protein SVXHr_1925 [Halorhabdus sp. SVX81]|uniref:hypothetical protein n=1 Tax=Halorhabdus sp. SVX81 TaxID=2978283 RepID=UPI0023D9EED7|nr:hypothetical protein [Halorhabdus sp. SVX81]WEL18087.1 Uncharacterized protein SVXHr_1925 [Halorhabdus sp. SVX81]
MAKVSIGLRGWRFEEDDVFDDDGSLKTLVEMPPDTRSRILRLTALVGEPCDACYLEHGEANVAECNVGSIVYGEPTGTVLLCGPHESDFLYWYREEGGSDLAGEPELANAFQEWFDSGGRAPAGYGGLEHVEEDREELPDVSSGALDSLENELCAMDEAEREELDADVEDLDLDIDE